MATLSKLTQSGSAPQAVWLINWNTENQTRYTTLDIVTETAQHLAATTAEPIPVVDSSGYLKFIVWPSGELFHVVHPEEDLAWQQSTS